MGSHPRLAELADGRAASLTPDALTRRRVDPVEAAQLTGHSLNVWTRYYARSFGKAQRDETRARMLEHRARDLRPA